MTREQFTEYVKDSQKALRRFLTALCCGDTALADDIAQETYLKAYLSCDTIRDSAKFQAWVRRIAYNTFISYTRTVHAAAGVDEAESLTSGDCSDEAYRYQELYAALDSLSAKERTAVLLHYLEGYSIKEVCDITDASPDAVRQQLSRGRYHLRKLLCKTI